MKKFKRSDLIVPISILAHLCIINGILWLLTPDTYINPKNYIYYNFSWLLITYWSNYYHTARMEQFFSKIRKTINLFIIYTLSYFAFFSFTGQNIGSFKYQVYVLGLMGLCLIWYRVIFFWVLSSYRKLGGNSTNVIVVGRDDNFRKIRNVFDNSMLGYRFKGYFDDSPSENTTHLGNVIDCFEYAINNQIDEIYCAASKFSKAELQNLINFADNNLIRLKIIPDNKQIFSRAMSIEPYNNIPVLNLRQVPLDRQFSKIIKRSFDVVFSSLVIVGVLSWLSPILFILIKLESPGPLYFKQKRHGLKKSTFGCIKFRSMTTSEEAHTKMASKNDLRLTRIGKFIRKTSIDELPQFFNVFMGDMSVVGPRPHMEIHTFNYEISVDKYLVRHMVKPGITGLAQIKGFRGEILKKRDIINRTRLDIFYVEKWNILLDFNIVFATIFNVFKGEESAY